MSPPPVDHFSILPDALLVTILWLLPTRIAARTSLLSRRFRDLWKNSPSVELTRRDMPYPYDDNFVAMVDRVLLSRDDDTHPLLSLYIDLSSSTMCDSFIYSLFVKLRTFRLCHLVVEGWYSESLSSVLPDIFSIESLESLSLDTITTQTRFYNEIYVFPSAASLTRLRSLSLKLFRVDPDQFHLLISEFCSLEDLSIKVGAMDRLSIASNTIRKLNLVIVACTPKLDIVMLRLPSLELLHFENDGYFAHHLPRFQGEIPFLTKAVLTLGCVREKDCSAVAGLVNYVSHAQELIMHVKEDMREKDPFLILSEPGRKVLNFPNLKCMEVTMCFCEHNLRAAISMVNHSPFLESVKLVHELPKFTGPAKRRTRKDWKSKLPRNADGNYRYAYFKDLHLGEKRKNFLKVLSKKSTSKNQA